MHRSSWHHREISDFQVLHLAEIQISIRSHFGSSCASLWVAEMVIARARGKLLSHARILATRSASTASGTEADVVSQPELWQVRRYAVNVAIPMVGFGIMDNLIMIQVGEQIDLTFGVSFGLQTMTAAGFGQVISDTAGVCSGLSLV